MNHDNTTPTRSGQRWPLLLLALPAAVAIWSGWVGLGQMSGFGIVHPLPGIADGFELNSAITLPVGVEAYSAYALGTWLSARPIAGSARRFAAWSSLAALGLGLLGQVVYHLLTAAGYTTAPTAVVVFVACLPVLVLGAGAALHHLLGDPTSAAAEVTGIPAAPLVEPELVPAAAGPVSGRSQSRGKRAVPRRLLADYLAEARTHLGQLAEGAKPTPVWCRQVTGCSAGTSVKLAAALRSEYTTAPPQAKSAAQLSSSTCMTRTERKERVAWPSTRPSCTRTTP
jgi:hypothetical protein